MVVDVRGRGEITMNVNVGGGKIAMSWEAQYL